MDDQRIKRIARAMCRAARLDPDKPADQAQLCKISLAAPPAGAGAPPAWTLFLQRAEMFAVTHRDVAAAL